MITKNNYLLITLVSMVFPQISQASPFKLCRWAAEYDSAQDIPNIAKGEGFFTNPSNSYYYRENYKIVFKDGMVMVNESANPAVQKLRPYNTPSGAETIIVMDMAGNVYSKLASKAPGHKFSHSSFGFNEVRMAGTWKVEAGHIVALDDQSGHYAICWTQFNRAPKEPDGAFGAPTDLGIRDLLINKLCAEKAVPEKGIAVTTITWADNNEAEDDSRLPSFIKTINRQQFSPASCAGH